MAFSRLIALTLLVVSTYQASAQTTTLRLEAGWNLVGNSVNQLLSVASTYSDAATVLSVWKWDSGKSSWLFYTPQMATAELQAYAAGKGYGVLSTINPGDGYWVNVKVPPVPLTQSGAVFNLTAESLIDGWNLVATGDNVTPSTFNQSLGSIPLITLWAWDNPLGKWYFYAPALEAQGGTALSDYIAGKGYLDFKSASKTLGSGTGFWVNRPNPSAKLSGLALSYVEDLPPVAANFKASAGRFPTPVASASWPIKIAPSISSPFSPREKASESGRYDWHRGVDIPGLLGEPVYSIADGKVEKIVHEGDPQAPEGGNTVYVAHSIDPAISFQGKPVSRFYSVHVHLQTIDPAMVVGASVAKGQQIGTLGQSGTTTFNHDHFEIRMQTTCSLEYQLQNPASTCAQYNFDPHVNPVQFLLPDDKTAPELVGISLSGTTLSASVKTGAPISDFDYIALVLKDVQGNIVYSREIGFNAREGFDASSVATLDIDKRNGVTFAPASFNTGATSYGISFSYDLSGLAVVPASGGLLIQDVWGNTRTFSLSFK